MGKIADLQHAGRPLVADAVIDRLMFSTGYYHRLADDLEMHWTMARGHCSSLAEYC